MEKLNFIRNFSEDEKAFRKTHPDIFDRYTSYVSYYTLKTGKNPLEENDYSSVIIKSLIAYFIYQERIYGKKITLLDVAKLLNYKDHSGAVYAIKRVKNLLKMQSKYRVFGKPLRLYFITFNGIFHRGLNKSRLVIS